MKITNKKQLLAFIVIVNIVIFSSCSLLMWYLFEMSPVPLMASCAVMITWQYKARKKQLGY